MSAAFDQKNVTVTEFGVGLETEGKQRFILVPVDKGVQDALHEMVAETQAAMKRVEQTAIAFDPGEKYESREHLEIPLADDLSSQLRMIHTATNMPIETDALENPENVFCYFARMTDAKGHKLTGVRRATTFKGVLKSRLVRLATDALKIVDEKVFKLDHEFDLLVEGTDVEILHPAGFVFVGALEEEIRNATPKNIKAIKADLPFVDFGPIEAYALKHSQAARYIAAIRTRKEAKNIDKSYLKRLCKSTGVNIEDVDGKLKVEPESIMGFLRVLDRRNYQVELVKGSPESYQAGSRKPIGTQ